MGRSISKSSRLKSRSPAAASSNGIHIPRFAPTSMTESSNSSIYQTQSADCLVFAAGPCSFVDLRASYVMPGAMYGDFVFHVPLKVDPKNREDEEVVAGFMPAKGKMVRRHHVQNTRISAIISLHEAISRNSDPSFNLSPISRGSNSRGELKLGAVQAYLSFHRPTATIVHRWRSRSVAFSFQAASSIPLE